MANEPVVAHLANEPVEAHKPAIQDDLAIVLDNIEKEDAVMKVDEELLPEQEVAIDQVDE